MPIVAELNESVEVTVPPILNPRLVWLRDAAIPTGNDSVRVTAPEKSLRLLNVIVDVPKAPVSIVAEVGVAEMENSETLTVMVVEWVRVPLVAPTVTVWMPVVEELKLQIEMAEAPEVKATGVGVHEVVRPMEGATDVDSVRDPENPFRLVSVIVDVPDEPAGKVTVDELATTLNPDGVTTVTLMIAAWDNEPLVPVNVTA